MIVFPAWYRGGFPDRELVVMDLLAPFLGLLADESGPRPGLACSWLPADYGDHLPIVRVYRVGGSADDGVDVAAVQLGVIGADRAESWAVAEFCRQIMLSFTDGGTVARADGTATLVDSITEMAGPVQLPELNPDFRLVPVTFAVICRRPRGTPDYRTVRESL